MDALKYGWHVVQIDIRILAIAAIVKINKTIVAIEETVVEVVEYVLTKIEEVLQRMIDRRTGHRRGGLGIGP